MRAHSEKMTCFQRGRFVLTLWVLSSLPLKYVKVRALALFQRDLFDGQRKGQHPKSNVGLEMFWMVGGSLRCSGWLVADPTLVEPGA